MKVGKEVRTHSLNRNAKSISRRSGSRPKARGIARATLLMVALINIWALPVNISPSFATAAAVGGQLNIWWPTESARVGGVQPFKAELPGMDVSQYEMFWQVDEGQENLMASNYQDHPHKEVAVDLSGWSWKGSGPYTIGFAAKQGGVVVAKRAVNIYIDNGLPAQAEPAVQPAQPAPAPTQTTAPIVEVAPPQLVIEAPTVLLPNDPDPVHALQMQSLILAVQNGTDTDPVHIAQVNEYLSKVAQPVQQDTSVPPAPAAPLALPAAPVVPPAAPAVSSGGSWYVEPNSSAARQANEWRNSRPSDAQKMDILAAQPTARWFGGWSGDIYSATNAYVGAAAAVGKTPVLAAYNIPQRDCGGYSAGGAADYTSWIGAFARGIGNRPAVVILEPDSLAQISCLSAGDRERRYKLLAGAVSVLKSNPNTKVYLDAGHSNWIEPRVMADRLQKANVARADGFATNVSNFVATDQEVAYGTTLSQKLGGKHFVVDTSRNGNGSNGEWCNPWGRAVGTKPTTTTGNGLVDAYLWIKTPGESDGTCNGAPSAGTWWADYALSLVR